jgi:pimeloyl-ACP methyl ester carboxylesterase
MQPSTSTTPSPRPAIGDREEQATVTKREDTIFELKQRLAAFHRTHPYKEIQVAGRQWRYVVGGQGERMLLLLPGGTLVPDTYFVILEALERSSRVIVPAYAAVPTMAELVAGVIAILDAEGVERVDVMGSSFGGYVAQCFVQEHPDRVDRLILAETAVRHFVSWGVPLYVLARLLRALPVGLVRFFMWRLWSTMFTASPEQQAFWLGLLKEILTTERGKANLVGVTENIYDFAAHYHFRSGDLAAWPSSLSERSPYPPSEMVYY